MNLRPLTLDDERLYERIYTEPQMWTELGGVVEQDMVVKLKRDVASVEADRDWVLVIVSRTMGAMPGRYPCGITNEWEGQMINEIGWMVLPEHQGRGPR